MVKAIGSVSGAAGTVSCSIASAEAVSSSRGLFVELSAVDRVVSLSGVGTGLSYFEFNVFCFTISTPRS